MNDARPVVVTGAAGFIGAHLTRRLAGEGVPVRAFVRYTSRGERGLLDRLVPSPGPQLEVVAGDLRDPESVARAVEGAGTVLHLGAQIAIPYSYVNPRDFVETNVLGTLNVLQAARAAGVERLVHVSTSEVYGSAQELPITEGHPLRPQSPYAASKVGADKLVESYHASFGLPATIVRPFNTYGPGQSLRAVIPTIVAQALAGGPLRLGALEPRRDLTYVEDTVEGILALARSPRAVGRTVQLGTGLDVAVADLVALAGELLGRELEVVRDPARVRPPGSEVDVLRSDPALARELAGWRARVELREGLGRTIEWMRAEGTARAGEYAL